MAKYTMTFYEYLEDHDLPSSMNMIDGFPDAFKGKYGASEIGFETDVLFSNRLKQVSDMVMPIYAPKYKMYEDLIIALRSPTKIRKETRTYGETSSESENNGQNTELPFDADTATPSNTSKMSSSAKTGEHEDEVIVNDYLTIDEDLKRLDVALSNRESVIESCLDEFKRLFMQVY